ncbi:hypothetical protein [Enterococcus sp. AZ126]|uniref:hypothetical protein n=1 Tax=Enterococcus sp. AZ126 TaxID=2774635 RepID=UPI003F1E5865
MKSKILIAAFLASSIATVLGTSVMLDKPVVANNFEHSSMHEKNNKQDEVKMNPTILQAVKRAKQDPEFWESEDEFDDSDTILAVDGGFLKGEMEDEENGVILNSDTDPNATTLGEVRKAIAEYTN